MRTKMPYPRKRKPPVKEELSEHEAAAWGDSQDKSPKPTAKETGVRNLHPFADIAKL